MTLHDSTVPYTTKQYNRTQQNARQRNHDNAIQYNTMHFIPKWLPI